MNRFLIAFLLLSGFFMQEANAGNDSLTIFMTNVTERDHATADVLIPLFDWRNGAEGPRWGWAYPSPCQEYIAYHYRTEERVTAAVIKVDDILREGAKLDELDKVIIYDEPPQDNGFRPVEIKWGPDSKELAVEFALKNGNYWAFFRYDARTGERFPDEEEEFGFEVLKNADVAYPPRQFFRPPKAGLREPAWCICGKYFEFGDSPGSPEIEGHTLFREVFREYGKRVLIIDWPKDPYDNSIIETYELKVHSDPHSYYDLLGHVFQSQKCVGTFPMWRTGFIDDFIPVKIGNQLWFKIVLAETQMDEDGSSRIITKVTSVPFGEIQGFSVSRLKEGNLLVRTRREGGSGTFYVLKLNEALKRSIPLHQWFSEHEGE